MPIPVPVRLCVLIALVLGAGLVASPARAQPVSPAELRREIDRLQAENLRLATQVQTLTTRLSEAEEARDEASRRAEQLAIAVERLRGDLQTRNEQINELIPEGTDPPSLDPQAPTQAEVPADPMASPASLLAELQRRYAADLAGGEQHDPAAAVPALTPARRKQLDDWCVDQARAVHGPIEWRVRFTDLRQAARNDRRALMTVIDPPTGLPIGPTLEVAVPRALADRLARELGVDGGDDKAPLWTLTGTMTAAPKLNPDRPTPGVFNHPLFVGPFVEFDFGLDWRNVVVVEPSATRTQGAAPSQER